MKRYINFFDIGAAGGISTSLDLIARKGTSLFRFYGIEPNQNEISKIIDKGYKKIINKGLSQKGGKRTLYLTKVPMCSSLLKPNLKNIPEKIRDNYVVTGKEEVETITLKIFEEILKVNPNWLKIDTQGLEGEILSNYDFNEELVFIMLELSSKEQYKSQILTSQVIDHLQKNDFDPCKIIYKTTCPFEHDIYFIKRESNLKSINSKFAAGYAHLIFGNIPLGYKLIKESCGRKYSMYFFIKIILLKFIVSLKRDLINNLFIHIKL